MLESIEIRNFKAIKDEPLPNVVAGLNPPGEKIFEQRDGIWYKKKPLILNNLTNVNYLVGENGSGKSSVLEGLFGRSKVEEKVKLTLKLSDSQIDSLQTDKTRFTENQINQLKKIKIETPSSKEMPIIISKQISEKIAIITREDKDSTDICNRAIDFLKYISVRALTSNEVQYTELRESYDKSLNEYNNYILNFKFNPSYIENHNLLKDFLNKYFFKGNEVFDINRDANKDLLRVVTTKYDIVELNSLAGGYQFLFGLYSSITKAINYNELNTVVLIEEPEIALHPNMQKLIPEIVRSFAEKGVQFLISTHSPFIISEAGKIAEEERAKGNDPSQKVYLIEGGECKNSNGNYGVDAIGKAAKMLGAGLRDVSIHSGRTDLSKTNYLVFCEGGNSEICFKDEEVYNIIFQNGIDGKKCNFVSCGDWIDVEKTYETMKEIYSVSSTTTEVKMIIDGDNQNDGKKRLGRYSIENYLFDPEILRLAFPDEDYSEIYSKWNYKEDKIKTKIKGTKLAFDKQKVLKLAECIRDNSQTTTYQELHDCIFGSSVKPDK